MLDFFESIVNFFELIWEFISNILSGIINLLKIVSMALPLPSFLVAFVPGIIGSCILAVLAIGVGKLIIGWGNK